MPRRLGDQSEDGDADGELHDHDGERHEDQQVGLRDRIRTVEEPDLQCDEQACDRRLCLGVIAAGFAIRLVAWRTKARAKLRKTSKTAAD